MKRYLPYLKLFKPVRWHLIGGIIAGLLFAVATGAGVPLATKTVFPLIFPSESSRAGGQEQANWLVEAIAGILGDVERDVIVIIACFWLPGMFFFRAVFGFLNGYLISYCGFRVLEVIRRDVFVKLQHLPISFFDRHQSGDLVARLVGDAELLRFVITRISQDVIKQPAVLIAALGFLVTEAIRHEGTFIVLISVLTIPLCVMPLQAIAKKMGKKARSLQENAGDLSGQIAETLQAPMEIRAYNLQERVIDRFHQTVAQIIRYSMKVIKYRLFVSPSVEFIAVLGLTIALIIGAQADDVMSLEQFIAIALALHLSYEPIKKLGEIHSLMKQGEAALDRLEEVLHTSDQVREAKNPKRPEVFRAEIALDQVRFAYGEEEILKGISTTIQPGECVAVIGPSGAGKSSLFKLIPRFYDVTSGSVKVSGIDVRDWSKKELRDHVAVVSQSPILFKGTIRENILLGRPDATEQEMIASAKRANAHDFILSQKSGYDTNISEQGASLSGGQRQRIAIARAFLKDAPILLLDEATSALDNESEAKIQESLAELVKNRTTLMIAHRLTTTRIANRVLEVEQGEIVSERAQA